MARFVEDENLTPGQKQQIDQIVKKWALKKLMKEAPEGCPFAIDKSILITLRALSQIDDNGTLLNFFLKLVDCNAPKEKVPCSTCGRNFVIACKAQG